ncbi:hypothetical protein Afil01_44250 [Actinorhabdospora filicis]|uniref:N-acetyltransferase domain-containing protein n=2 Tax=Actinorhabdospora filicis TaxID=1785913 RepID=A0A9W6SP95_9ACTN|nr:hypothetical protein Afil01_44250 [Actinorhabdospora filicis]
MLRRQARNSAAFWAAKGRARGHEVVRERGFLAAAGDERAGLRVLIQEPDLSAAELDAIGDLVKAASGPVDVEDPYSATDLSAFGWRSWQMPVMARPAGPAAAPAMEVVQVAGEADLREAERVVIESFGLARFEPYRAGELFPPSFLEQEGVGVFVARLDGEVAGAAVTVVAGGWGSHYWVGTSEKFRSRGAGRAVMLGSLAAADVPWTLTASRLGRPLYESLGYSEAAPSTWWSSTP